jgi:hypothetical protein
VIGCIWEGGRQVTSYWGMAILITLIVTYLIFIEYISNFVGYCEHHNGTSGSIKGGEFVDYTQVRERMKYGWWKSQMTACSPTLPTLQTYPLSAPMTNQECKESASVDRTSQNISDNQ